MSTAIGQLDGDLKATLATVKERAATIADILQVQAAVATNEDTARDMWRTGALKFSPQGGETIELGQVVAGNAPTPLLIQPEGASRSPHASTPGSYAELVDNQIYVTQVTPVTPKDRANELSGYVAVRRPLELGPAIAALTAANVAGSFEIDGKAKTIGTPEPGARRSAMPLRSLPSAQLIVAAPVAASGVAPFPLIAGGAGLAVLGVVLTAYGLLRRTHAPSTPAPAPAPALSHAPTEWGPTPTPIPISRPSFDTASSAPPGTLASGAMIGRWEILRHLGTGGMASVYLARARGEAGFEKQVAIKVMHPHLARNESAVEHFLDEAKLAAHISHPNVVQILDLGKIGSDFVIVMEYVEGVDLEQLLSEARRAQRPVPIDVGLGIVRRICDGLNAAHNATTSDGQPMNLVHRDVKSANVLVSLQGGVKVVDFGIAKAVTQNHLTVAGETKGTPSMMAPEQRVGDRVDVRADVYSLGAIAYEIVTGCSVNLDLAALAHLGVDNWPHLQAPSKVRPQIPPELDPLIMSAMAFERDRRPADCAVFEAAIEAIMKANTLVATDKDIARWVAEGLAMRKA
jgi:tRNA A-37 threonylcarbamoyl transferase component Bud32